MILLITLFDNIYMNIIVPWVGLVGWGPTVTIGFFGPIRGVGGLSDWGQTNNLAQAHECAHHSGLGGRWGLAPMGSLRLACHPQMDRHQSGLVLTCRGTGPTAANYQFAALIHHVDHQLRLYNAQAD